MDYLKVSEFFFIINKYGQIVVLVLYVYHECDSNVSHVIIVLIIIGCNPYSHLHHLPMQLNCARVVLS